MKKTVDKVFSCYLGGQRAIIEELNSMLRDMGLSFFLDWQMVFMFSLPTSCPKVMIGISNHLDLDSDHQSILQTADSGK